MVDGWRGRTETAGRSGWVGKHYENKYKTLDFFVNNLGIS